MSLAASTKKHDAGRIPGPWNCPGVVEIRMQQGLPNGKTIFSTIHGSYASAPSNMQGLANSLWSSLSSAWSANLAQYMHPQTTFQAVQIRDMASYTNPVFFGTGTAVPGTGTGVALPESNAIAMTENIASRGKGLKGRVFLGGWVQGADVTTGGISTAVQTAINAFGTAITAALNASTPQLTPCVAQAARYAYIGYTGTTHQARGNAGPPPVGTHVTVNSYVCRDLVWDTQRRRVQI
jgi:hypothetical protein